MKEIFIYSTLNGWLNDKPDTVLNGEVKEKFDGYIEIQDAEGYTQILVLDKLFAVVY
ncbi:MAG: hypothetical protein AB9903_17130 [Vulcanimicrobiota bacterium]